MRDVGKNTNIANLAALPTSGMQEGDECVFNGYPMTYSGGTWRPNIGAYSVAFKKNDTVVTGTLSSGVFTASANGSIASQLETNLNPVAGNTFISDKMSLTSSPSTYKDLVGVWEIVNPGNASTPWSARRVAIFPAPASVDGVVFFPRWSKSSADGTLGAAYVGSSLKTATGNSAYDGFYNFIKIGLTPSTAGGLETDGATIGIKAGGVTRSMLAADAQPVVFVGSPSNAWYGAGDTKYITNNNTFQRLVDGSNTGSSLQIPLDLTSARTWLVHAELMVAADSGNWTPFVFRLEHYAGSNGAGTLTAAREAYGNSNNGKVQSGLGADWVNLTIEMIITVPQGSGYHSVIPWVKTIGPYGGQYHRHWNYNTMHALRVQ